MFECWHIRQPRLHPSFIILSSLYALIQLLGLFGYVSTNESQPSTQGGIDIEAQPLVVASKVEVPLASSTANISSTSYFYQRAEYAGIIFKIDPLRFVETLGDDT